MDSSDDEFQQRPPKLARVLPKQAVSNPRSSAMPKKNVTQKLSSAALSGGGNDVGGAEAGQLKRSSSTAMSQQQRQQLKQQPKQSQPEDPLRAKEPKNSSLSVSLPSCVVSPLQQQQQRVAAVMKQCSNSNAQLAAQVAPTDIATDSGHADLKPLDLHHVHGLFVRPAGTCTAAQSTVAGSSAAAAAGRQPSFGQVAQEPAVPLGCCTSGDSAVLGSSLLLPASAAALTTTTTAALAATAAATAAVVAGDGPGAAFGRQGQLPAPLNSEQTTEGPTPCAAAAVVQAASAPAVRGSHGSSSRCQWPPNQLPPAVPPAALQTMVETTAAAASDLSLDVSRHVGRMCAAAQHAQHAGETKCSAGSGSRSDGNGGGSGGSSDQRAAISSGGGRGGSELAGWLAGLGLGKYADCFLRAELDLSVVRLLEDADLKQLGMAALGARKKLLAAIQAMGNTTPTIATTAATTGTAATTTAAATAVAVAAGSYNWDATTAIAGDDAAAAPVGAAMSGMLPWSSNCGSGAEAAAGGGGSSNGGHPCGDAEHRGWGAGSSAGIYPGAAGEDGHAQGDERQGQLSEGGEDDGGNVWGDNDNDGGDHRVRSGGAKCEGSSGAEGGCFYLNCDEDDGSGHAAGQWEWDGGEGLWDIAGLGQGAAGSPPIGAAGDSCSGGDCARSDGPQPTLAVTCAAAPAADSIIAYPSVAATRQLRQATLVLGTGGFGLAAAPLVPQQQLWPIFRPQANPRQLRPSSSINPPDTIPRSAAASGGRGSGRGGGRGRAGRWGRNVVGGGQGRGNNGVRSGGPLRLPPWQAVPGMPFVVDRFGIDYKSVVPACRHWFLTHFHADHYKGLTKHFDGGTVYCNSITAALAHLRLRVPTSNIRVLPMDGSPTRIEGVGVSLLDANHCPGAAMLVFEPQQGNPVVHTGDCRCCESMRSSPALNRVRGRCTLVLDTTYCSPQYDFPPQDVVVRFVLDAVRAEMFNGPRTLFVFGTYTIGKERIFLEVARSLRKKVYVSKEKLAILQACELPRDVAGLLTSEESCTNLHAVPLWGVNMKRLAGLAKQYNGRYSTIVGFQPTGWAHAKDSKASGPKEPGRRQQRGTLVLYSVPYSEHSSFNELKDFVSWLQPRRIIPSVGNDHGGPKAQHMVTLLGGNPSGF